MRHLFQRTRHPRCDRSNETPALLHGHSLKPLRKPLLALDPLLMSLYPCDWLIQETVIRVIWDQGRSWRYTGLCQTLHLLPLLASGHKGHCVSLGVARPNTGALSVVTARSE